MANEGEKKSEKTPPLNYQTDEAWRERVEREREEMRRAETPDGEPAQAGQQEMAAPEPEPETPAPETPEREVGDAESQGGGEHPKEPLPEPSLETFLAGLYTQTLMTLGLIANPVTKSTEKDLSQSRFLIDTLELLRVKMEGNLSAAEQQYFDGILYDLRMRFVQQSK